MWAIAAGSVFWALLVLFPVTAQESNNRCVTNKHRDICALKGSSVDFLCAFPKNVRISSLSGWSRLYGPEKRWKPLQQISAYSSRAEVSESGCMLRLRDLKKSDTSIYHFIYSNSNATGHTSTCLGNRVRLNVFDWAVRIFVGAPMGKHDSWVMIEGQRVILTCKPTCSSYVNSNTRYIWYKNRWQLDDNKTSSYFLSLDPVSVEDTGSYICAMVGYEDHPSSAVSLQVQRRQSSTGASTTGRTQSFTHELSTQNSTDQPFNSYQTPKNKGMFWISVLLATGVSVGLIIGITTTVLIFKSKQKIKRKRRQHTGLLTKPPDPNCDVYMAMDVSLASPEYETMNIVSPSSPEYETLNIVSSSPEYETLNIVPSSPEYETMKIVSPSSPEYETLNIVFSSPEYETLNIVSSSPEYETLNIVKHCSVAETVHENSCQHETLSDGGNYKNCTSSPLRNNETQKVCAKGIISVSAELITVLMESNH